MSAFLGGALMVLPATSCGVLADWPAGAIFPATVFILQLRMVQDLKWYQLKSVEDLKTVEKEPNSENSIEFPGLAWIGQSQF